MSCWMNLTCLSNSCFQTPPCHSNSIDKLSTGFPLSSFGVDAIIFLTAHKLGIHSWSPRMPGTIRSEIVIRYFTAPPWPPGPVPQQKMARQMPHRAQFFRPELKLPEKPDH